MSEITVTMPLSEYEKMKKEIEQLRKESQKNLKRLAKIANRANGGL